MSLPFECSSRQGNCSQLLNEMGSLFHISSWLLSLHYSNKTSVHGKICKTSCWGCGGKLQWWRDGALSIVIVHLHCSFFISHEIVLHVSLHHAWCELSSSGKAKSDNFWSGNQNMLPLIRVWKFIATWSASQFMHPQISNLSYGHLLSWWAFTHQSLCQSVDSFMRSTITDIMSTSSLYCCLLEPFCCVLLIREIAALLSMHLITLLVDSILWYFMK